MKLKTVEWQWTYGIDYLLIGLEKVVEKARECAGKEIRIRGEIGSIISVALELMAAESGHGAIRQTTTPSLPPNLLPS